MRARVPHKRAPRSGGRDCPIWTRKAAALLAGEFALGGEICEPLDGGGRVLAHFDEVAVWVAHVASPLGAVVIERRGEEMGALGTPIFVAGPDIRYAQVQEAAHSVQLGRRFQDHFGLVGRWFAAGIKDEPRIGQLNVQGFSSFTTFPPSTFT